MNYVLLILDERRKRLRETLATPTHLLLLYDRAVRHPHTPRNTNLLQLYTQRQKIVGRPDVDDAQPQQQNVVPAIHRQFVYLRHVGLCLLQLDRLPIVDGRWRKYRCLACAEKVIRVRAMSAESA